jgi:large subunit ribosomal protein L6
MSRIGKAPILIPHGVQVTVSKSNLVTVKGPKGELSEQVNPDLIINIQDNVINVVRPTEQKRHKAMHGLYRTLISNMVEGVSKGFKIRQEVVGVGYKITSAAQDLDLAIGYSHDIIFELPEEVKVTTETPKGKSPVITLESHDKQLLGQVAAKIRSFRKPEPYKGKGIKFENEVIRRKAGKTASAK